MRYASPRLPFAALLGRVSSLDLEAGFVIGARRPFYLNADTMTLVGGWLATVVPFVGWRGRAPMPNPCPPIRASVPNHCPATTDSPDFTANFRQPTPAHTDAQPLPGTDDQSLPISGIVAVRMVPSDGHRLWFVADASRPAPDSFESAVEQFLDLMGDAIAREYLPETILFTDLRRFYDGIVSKFEWPELSDKRLSMLLERHGCRKTVQRDRSGGKDRRIVAFDIPEKHSKRAAA